VAQKHDAFRSERATELQNLYEVVSKLGIIDPGPLGKARNEVSRNKPHGEASWGYSVDTVLFDVKNAPDIFPAAATGLTAEFSMDLEGVYVEEDDDDDPFTSLAIDLIIRGYIGDGRDRRRLSFYWHLDRDRRQPGDGPQAEYHPRYHFQHGGNRVPRTDYTIGDTLFMDPPRLIHPPMDAILAVDFVLANFCTSIWRDAYDNNIEYTALLSEAQRRCWRPFFIVMARHWELGPQDQACLDLQPCLVPKRR
jgi:hypothetical protein